MGAWGAGNFSNDTALDFIQSLDGVDSVASFLRAKRPSPLEADEASEILAAADLVAAMMGRPAPDMPEDAMEALGEHGFPDSGLLKDARSAVERVRDRSELAELWAESDEQEWREAIDDLLLRLDPDSDYEPPQATDSTPGPVYACCFLCEKLGIEGDEIVDLVHEIDDGIIRSSITLHAHRSCVETKFEPPHWNSDGSPSKAVLAQFADLIGVNDDG